MEAIIKCPKGPIGENLLFNRFASNLEKGYLARRQSADKKIIQSNVN